MSTTKNLIGLVEVVEGPYQGVRGVVLAGVGQAGRHAFEAIRVSEDPKGRLGAGVIERFDPALLKEVDPALSIPAVLP